jgi:hypothetical protein
MQRLLEPILIPTLPRSKFQRLSLSALIFADAGSYRFGDAVLAIGNALDWDNPFRWESSAPLIIYAIWKRKKARWWIAALNVILAFCGGVPVVGLWIWARLSQEQPLPLDRQP